MAKLSAKEIKEHTKTVQELIDKQKRENKLQHFVALKPEEIEAKLKRVNSPFFMSGGWSDGTVGGTIFHSVIIYNPDPYSASDLYVHCWVGSGNIDPTVGTFLSNVDARFPRLTEPRPPIYGVTLAPGANVTLQFSFKVPTTVEKTRYLGNSCLMRLNYLDAGMYLDRFVFPFNVT